MSARDAEREMTRAALNPRYRPSLRVSEEDKAQAAAIEERIILLSETIRRLRRELLDASIELEQLDRMLMELGKS